MECTCLNDYKRGLFLTAVVDVLPTLKNLHEMELIAVVIDFLHDGKA